MPEEVQRDDYLRYKCIVCECEYFDKEDCEDCEDSHKTGTNQIL